MLARYVLEINLEKLLRKCVKEYDEGGVPENFLVKTLQMHDWKNGAKSIY